MTEEESDDEYERIWEFNLDCEMQSKPQTLVRTMILAHGSKAQRKTVLGRSTEIAFSTRSAQMSLTNQDSDE